MIDCGGKSLCGIIDKYKDEWLSKKSTTTPICTGMTWDEASLNGSDCDFYNYHDRKNIGTGKSNSMFCQSL